MDEIFGEVGGGRGEFTESVLFVGIEKPISGEFGEIFTRASHGV